MLIGSGPGIVGDKLVGSPSSFQYKGGVKLYSGAITMPADVRSVIVEYDSFRTYSDAYQYNSVAFKSNTGIYWSFKDDITDGAYNSHDFGWYRYRQGNEFSDHVAYYDEYKYQYVNMGLGLFKTRLTVRDGGVEWLVKDVETGVETTISIALPPEFRIADLVGASVGALSVGSGSTWMDNVKIQCLR